MPAAEAPAAPAVRMVTVGEEGAGQRLDNYLIRLLKGVPKTHVYRVIRSGEVRVNKGRAAADTRLTPGDVLRVPPVRVAEVVESAPVVPREFPILFEDDWLLAIDKPAGVAVHGGSGLAFGVIEQLRRARPAAPFLELVHRIDRDTSGILLVAKKRAALTRLQDQFRERETGKTYLALVVGAWSGRTGATKVIDLPLHKYVDAAGERRVRVTTADDPDGMRSISLARLRHTRPAAGALPALTLLEVTIKTGRTHQIRVHLQAQGCPIAGDDKYGDAATNALLARAGLKRMFLHAWRLQFDHPVSGERHAVESPVPPALLPWSVPPIPSTDA